MRSIALAALFLSACASAPPVADSEKEQSHQGPQLEPPSDDRVSKAVRPLSYDLLLDVDPAQEGYGGQVKIHLHLSEPTRVIWLHSLDHDIQSSTLQRAGKRWTNLKTQRAGKDWLAVQLPEVIPAGDAFLALRFSGRFKNPLFGIYRVQEAEDWYLFSQLEALGAREAFPCFDEPGFKTPFTVRVVAPKGDKVFFNTPKEEEKPGRAGKILHRFAVTKPLPTYLLAFAVGPLDLLHKPEWDLQRDDGTRLQIRLIAAKGKAQRGLTALRETRTLLALEEDYFGSPYPYAKLDIVAVPDFAAGAMENPGLITYREQLLLFDEKVDPVNRYRAYANVHAHELAHIWFGDLVTMSWWDDLWLNEAFATWFAAKMVNQYKPEWQVLTDRLGGFNRVKESDSTTTSRRIREPIKSRGDIHNAFDGITYTKGHAVLSMFEQYVGEEPFRDGIRAYLRKHAWKNATYADLLTELEAASGKTGLREAFETFLTQAGVPNVSMTGGATGCGPFELRQVRWQPFGSPPLARQRPWQIPLCFKDLGTGTQHCHVFKTDKESLDFSDRNCTGPLLPNPGGSSYLVASLGEDWLQGLLDAQSKLSDLEQVALLYDLRKAYSAGNLQPKRVMAISKTLSPSSDRVAQQLMGLVGDLGGLVNDEMRPDWRRFLGRLAASRVAPEGWGEDGQDDSAHWRVRRTVLSWSSRWGDRPDLKAQALAMAEDLIAGKAVERELASTALGILTEDGDAALFDRLLAAFEKAEDPWLRGTLLRGLASFRRPALSQRSLELSLSDKLRANERSRLIWGSSGDYRVRDKAWAWVQKHLSTIRELLPRNSARYLVYYPSSQCSKKALADIDRVFAPYLEGEERMEGLARHLSSAKESIQRCLAMRARHQEELQGLLTPAP